MALQRGVSVQRKAFIGDLNCKCFLIKREIPYITYFLLLLELSKSLGGSYLSDMQVGGIMPHYF